MTSEKTMSRLVPSRARLVQLLSSSAVARALGVLTLLSFIPMVFDMNVIFDTAQDVNISVVAKYIAFAMATATLICLTVACVGTKSNRGKADANRATQSVIEAEVDRRESIMFGVQDRYVLEIRALGLNIENASQDELWKPVVALKSATESVYSQREADYPQRASDRRHQYTIASASAAEGVGVAAVSDWPIPAFAAQPASHATAKTSAGESAGGELVDASFVYTYAIWVDDINGEDASPLVDRVFEFFDTHPEVPEVIVMCKDGDSVRQYLTARGMGEVQGPHKPERLLSIATLLVSRTDRVDRFIRPYAIHETKGATTPQQTKYDYIKLFNFYWREDKAYRSLHASTRGSTTIKSDYWATHLPGFLKTIDDKGVAGFERTPYLPLRWTSWQVKMFDRAPLMGYLHRPITVRLRDEDDHPLKGEALAEALGAGWQRALGTLPEGETPVRVFRDTRNDHGLTRVLAPILMEQPLPLDLNTMDQGFDIGIRIGNTGIASPFVQIAFGTMASYKLGGASATVHRRENGDLTFTMVSPPDAKSKAAWEGETARNPFYYHVH